MGGALVRGSLNSDDVNDVPEHNGDVVAMWCRPDSSTIDEGTTNYACFGTDNNKSKTFALLVRTKQLRTTCEHAESATHRVNSEKESCGGERKIRHVRTAPC